LVQERILDPQKLVGIRPQNESVLADNVPGYMAGARNLKKDTMTAKASVMPVCGRGTARM
jgi:hypothetical protein